MSYKLEFHPLALREWKKLDATVQAQFKAKLRERLETPCVPAARVSGGTDLYKIKLRASGFRLVYQVQEARIVVLVLAVGRREGNAAYDAALKRID